MLGRFEKCETLTVDLDGAVATITMNQAATSELRTVGISASTRGRLSCRGHAT